MYAVVRTSKKGEDLSHSVKTSFVGFENECSFQKEGIVICSHSCYVPKEYQYETKKEADLIKDFREYRCKRMTKAGVDTKITTYKVVKLEKKIINKWVWVETK